MVKMNDTLPERLLVAVAGPVTAAIIGTLLIGLLVSWITRRATDRRTRYEIRHELITQMTETTSALVYTIAHYRRTKEGELGEVSLNDIAPVLHEQYRKTRTAGTVLEHRLEVYFQSDEPRRYWHASVDLLAVTYYHAIGLASEKLLRSNAGDSHTGLGVEDLADPDVTFERYRDMMRKATIAVRTEPLAPLSSSN
jgi:hypothetical protein